MIGSLTILESKPSLRVNVHSSVARMRYLKQLDGSLWLPSELCCEYSSAEKGHGIHVVSGHRSFLSRRCHALSQPITSTCKSRNCCRSFCICLQHAAHVRAGFLGSSLRRLLSHERTVQHCRSVFGIPDSSFTERWAVGLSVTCSSHEQCHTSAHYRRDAN